MSEHVPSWRDFPDFYDNPTIKRLGRNRRWAISGRLGDDGEDKGKAPISMTPFVHPTLYSWEPHVPVFGNSAQPHQMVTLDELCELVPHAANCAYRVNEPFDGVIVLDIEKDVDPALRERLLACDWVYGETSMSGQGIHLVVPTPQDMRSRFPEAMTKTVCKLFSGTVEVLLDHWVTFTRNVIERPADHGTASLTDILAPEMERMRNVSVDAVDVSALEPDSAGYRTSLPLFQGSYNEPDPRYRRKLEDYDNDVSRMEFALFMRVAKYVALSAKAFAGTSGIVLSDSELVWIVYRIAKQHLEWRPKHDELRLGVPYLLNQAQRAYELARMETEDRPIEQEE
jgi:hypothetical protein